MRPDCKSLPKIYIYFFIELKVHNVRNNFPKVLVKIQSRILFLSWYSWPEVQEYNKRITWYNIFTGSEAYGLIILNTQSIAKHTCKDNYKLSTKITLLYLYPQNPGTFKSEKTIKL